jgi:uncharacterized phage protein (TIGR01671 family)
MREILFRGKRLDNGECVEGFYYHLKSRYKGDKSFMYDAHKITTGIEETSGAYVEDNEFIEYNVIPETVGQYTGLTDKNGKKIFEGDIVKHYCNSEDKTIFDVGQFYWCENICQFRRTSRTEGQFYDVNGRCEYEVIGNIQDNPELLKGGVE